ncbi:hypothetical protein GJ699_03425 [Duganella sp. FT80W]|uniref:Uncharacterized protein n=1 Tax=Duganella guangzhouensis TaxID=2666084 RepID=A0A6I2KV98_9BURK|nr:hypothetical protein [Duganella guangzhouensis]MRW89027.1 hypothetical protein [Duganella guangzhouensis]
MLVEIEKIIEETEPGVMFAHLKQESHFAHGQQYIIHVCYLVATKQYRSYVFLDRAFVTWVLDPELDHSVLPTSSDGAAGIEKLITDTVREIDADNLRMYTNGALSV